MACAPTLLGACQCSVICGWGGEETRLAVCVPAKIGCSTATANFYRLSPPVTPTKCGMAGVSLFVPAVVLMIIMSEIKRVTQPPAPANGCFALSAALAHWPATSTATTTLVLLSRMDETCRICWAE